MDHRPRKRGAHYNSWALLATLLVSALLYTCIRARRDIPKPSIALILALLACAALYLVAPALSIPVSSPDGEGARHFYLAWAYASLLLEWWWPGKRRNGKSVLHWWR